MLRAAVPEATTDFHGDAGRPEHDIGCPPYLWYRSGADPVSQGEVSVLYADQVGEFAYMAHASRSYDAEGWPAVARENQAKRGL